MAVYKTVSPAQLAASISEAATKTVVNNSGSAIPANSVLAWQPDGSVAPGSANSMSGLADFAGISTALIPSGQSGAVIKQGNVPGIMTGSGAIPGQEVYLSETAGLLTLTPPTSPNSTILRMGRAEPPSGSSGSATDLYLQLEIVSEA